MILTTIRFTTSSAKPCQVLDERSGDGEDVLVEQGQQAGCGKYQAID